MATFTLQEFIDKHKLDVVIQDSKAMRIITTKLRAEGYTQTRTMVDGVRRNLWSNDRKTNLDDLQKKIDTLKL